jgi:hypothetical protein
MYGANSLIKTPYAFNLSQCELILPLALFSQPKNRYSGRNLIN